MTIDLNATHDPARKSWIESANATDTDFPIQNLPFGLFRTKLDGSGARRCRAW
jgi:fumarylacetoacetase